MRETQIRMYPLRHCACLSCDVCYLCFVFVCSIVAGGVESMSRAPLVRHQKRNIEEDIEFNSAIGYRFPNQTMADMFPLESNPEIAETMAIKWGISREEQDMYAVESHQRALRAIQNGAFHDEIIPIHTPTGVFEVHN